MGSFLFLDKDIFKCNTYCIMWQIIKAFLEKRKKTFLEREDFKKRVDAELWQLAKAPWGWSVDALHDTNEDVEAWMHKNKKPITEKQYFSILKQHIDKYIDRPLPPNFSWPTLRDIKRNHFEPKV